MEKSVRNRARVMITTLGGDSSSPMAWRSMDSTTTMRTKQVMQTSTAWMKPSAVSPRKMRNALAISGDCS